jgi:class 3 adenylate cyclase
LIGLPGFERAELDQDLTRIVQGHYLGVPVSWREYPFEWVFEQWFEVTRIFDAPFPVERLVTLTTLARVDELHTRVDVTITMTARSLLGGRPARVLVEHKFLRDMRRVYQQLGELAREASAYIPPPPLRRPGVHQGRMAAAAARVRQAGIAETLVARLLTHLTEADDPDVIKMRPFALADRWGEPRLDVLRLFLYATRAGLLDLEWDVICPSCRGASERHTQLADLRSEAHCPSCLIRYDVDFEESVELRFTVSPDIRSAADLVFCVGGPANTRHIVMQLWLEPHSERQVHIRLGAGTYRLRSPQARNLGALEVARGARNASATVALSDDEIITEGRPLESATIALTLRNTGQQRAMLMLEQSAWNVQASSAALVASTGAFRQLLASHGLAPGLGISIRNLTFLFSDLKDSTAIYDRIGDTPAYARVRDHFGVMRASIARHDGALIKTIGDAVMAVFRSSEAALLAAVEIQREFTAGEIAQGNPALRVKLGLHRGPCIAVNANDVLDYFGSTVNIAARVQSESIGGDIVVTDELLEDPGVRLILERERARVEQFEQQLKGFSRTFALARVHLAEVAEALDTSAELQSQH